MQITANRSAILGLDFGDKRIGVATASIAARLPRPLMTVTNDGTALDKIKKLVQDEDAGGVVLGLPRGMDGQSTPQTKRVLGFGAQLEKYLEVPIYYQDEAVTSKMAEEELNRFGKPYDKSAIDALAATYILEDFFLSNKELK